MNEQELIINKIEDLEEMLLLKQREIEWIIKRIDYLKNKLVEKVDK